MKLLVALCTILTFQLCLIGASELEEHDVEDLDMEMEEDQDMEMDNDYIDSSAMELRHDKELCERNSRGGWGGRCLDWYHLLNQSCDYMWNGTDEIHGERLCHEHDLGEYCCVDCNDARQTRLCGRPKLGLMASRQCYPGWREYSTLDSGCDCCTKCKPSPRWCKGGFCVTNNDPTCNNKKCTAAGGILYPNKRCTGKGCSCCGPPPPPIPIAEYEALKKCAQIHNKPLKIVGVLYT